ncbi:GMC oxidoreductase [Actinomycetes bacterium KLBMP 9797]
MTFTSSTYTNMVSERVLAQQRLLLQYIGPRTDFDIIVVGSGIGGGLLADDLAEHAGTAKRILVLEAGSFLYPTHVYNFCRVPNSDVAQHYGCDTFRQGGNDRDEFFIGGKPQLNFGGRSIFWSGLIPSIQDWELGFFPDPVRDDLSSGLLNEAGTVMNESRSMGRTAQAIVAKLRQSHLAQDFVIHETPRALHQPYLSASGTPTDEFFTESTGVFNTAELLTNQFGLTPGVYHGDFNGLFLLLNHFAEDIQHHSGQYELVVRDVLTGQSRVFRAPTVVLAGGSIESPKLLRRSSLYPTLPQNVRDLIGVGLTDHPTTDWIATSVTNIGDVDIPRSAHAKIILYSRGLGDPEIRYPFNVEMNVNHEYWHLRENDPNDPERKPLQGPSRLELKFSFGNCLDDGNLIEQTEPFDYVPQLRFHNQRWMERLRDSRFPALAGWHKSYAEIFEVLNSVTHQILSQFRNNGGEARPDCDVWYGEEGKGFGYGTVHHACGSLRMPYRPARGSAIAPDSVVDTDLQVVGANGLYVCDMSVMPFSSAANPVRTLAALALRLSRRLR